MTNRNEEKREGEEMKLGEYAVFRVRDGVTKQETHPVFTLEEAEDYIEWMKTTRIHSIYPQTTYFHKLLKEQP